MNDLYDFKFDWWEQGFKSCKITLYSTLINLNDWNFVIEKIQSDNLKFKVFFLGDASGEFTSIDVKRYLVSGQINIHSIANKEILIGNIFGISAPIFKDQESSNEDNASLSENYVVGLLKLFFGAGILLDRLGSFYLNDDKDRYSYLSDAVEMPNFSPYIARNREIILNFLSQKKFSYNFEAVNIFKVSMDAKDQINRFILIWTCIQYSLDGVERKELTQKIGDFLGAKFDLFWYFRNQIFKEGRRVYISRTDEEILVFFGLISMMRQEIDSLDLHSISENFQLAEADETMKSYVIAQGS